MLGLLFAPQYLLVKSQAEVLNRPYSLFFTQKKQEFATFQLKNHQS